MLASLLKPKPLLDDESADWICHQFGWILQQFADDVEWVADRMSPEQAASVVVDRFARITRQLESLHARPSNHQ